MNDIYVHRKSGNLYKFITMGKLEQQGFEGETFVVYQSCVNNDVWIRPLIEWSTKFVSQDCYLLEQETAY